MFRSQTDEQLAAKWDPEPWKCSHCGYRSAERAAVVGVNGHPGHAIFDPRPECIPSYAAHLEWCASNDREPYDVAEFFESRPPVNPILAAFREYDALNRKAFLTWQDTMDGWTWRRFDFDPTPEQIDHARKVLTRLAALS